VIPAIVIALVLAVDAPDATVERLVQRTGYPKEFVLHVLSEQEKEMARMESEIAELKEKGKQGTSREKSKIRNEARKLEAELKIAKRAFGKSVHKPSRLRPPNLQQGDFGCFGDEIRVTQKLDEQSIEVELGVIHLPTIVGGPRIIQGQRTVEWSGPYRIVGLPSSVVAELATGDTYTYRDWILRCEIKDDAPGVLHYVGDMPSR